MAKKYFAATDLGGSKIYTVLASGTTVLASVKIATPRQSDPGSVLAAIKESVGTVMDKAGISQRNIEAAGICAAGFFDSRQRILVSSPNLPGWDNYPLEVELEKLLGVRVTAENDANAAALGEARQGAGRGFKNQVYITVSTGIGGGLILNNTVYRGGRGFAGEIGHITVLPDGPLCGCGRRGCLEAVASGTAIARMAKEAVLQGKGRMIAELAGGAEVAAPHVFAAAVQGDSTSVAIFDAAVKYLALGLVNIVNILNPEAIIIGGGVSEAGDMLIAPLREQVVQQAVAAAAANLEINKAGLGVEAGVRGMLELLAES